MRFDYTVIQEQPTTQCEYCRTNFNIKVTKEVPNISCPKCGLLPSKANPVWKYLFFFPLILVVLPLAITVFAVLVGAPSFRINMLLPPIGFLICVYFAYRSWLPKRLDLNAPGFVHRRVDESWQYSPPRTADAQPDRYFRCLWFIIGILGLPVATISSLMILNYSGAKILFALSGILVFGILYLMRKHMYPIGENAKLKIEMAQQDYPALKIQNAMSSSEENLFQKALRLYRQSQPQYEPNSLSFPEFNEEKLRNAYELFCKCVETDPNNIDALLMKAQCIYDFYDRQQMAIAMEAVEKAIQLNPNNPRAYDIRGSLFYAMNSEDEKDKTIQLAIENGKKVLELNPQYSSDVGTKISTRTTTNEAFRRNVKGLEKELERLRLEKQLQAETQSASQPKASSPLGEFKKITTESALEAADALCKEGGAIQSVPVISEAKIRKHYLQVSSSWASEQLCEGSPNEIASIVLKNLQRLKSRQGFQNFTVETYTADDCAQVSALFSLGGYSFQPIRVWRSTEKMFVCGNAAFKP